MVGLALGLALIEDGAEARLNEVSAEDLLVDIDVNGNASCRRLNPRLFNGAAVDSGMFAFTVSVEATTTGPELVDTTSSRPSSSDPGCSTGHRLQLD
jgi:hypothetical protein